MKDFRCFSASKDEGIPLALRHEQRDGSHLERSAVGLHAVDGRPVLQFRSTCFPGVLDIVYGFSADQMAKALAQVLGIDQESGR